ncbi:MAG: hypothetical protein CMJ18_22500 [Phycisphaeraceae bacterium]|nr:hypothetical protein [Phycisphaeraceae bacterium]
MTIDPIDFRFATALDGPHILIDGAGPGRTDARLHFEYLMGTLDGEIFGGFFREKQTPRRIVDAGSEAILTGTIDERNRHRPDLPCVVRVRCASRPGRLHVQGEVSGLSDSFSPATIMPCLTADVLSHTNHPPFSMANRSFVFTESGLQWVSDLRRRASETHPGKDKGGPWICMYGTDEGVRRHERFRDEPAPPPRPCWGMYAESDTVGSPVTGWIAPASTHLMAIAGSNAFQVGPRWGPCLHSDIGLVGADGAVTLAFSLAAYFVPPDLDLLRELVHEDFSEDATRCMNVERANLWPWQEGRLLDSMDASSISQWTASTGALGVYRSEDIWINGNQQRVEYPEGVTHGDASLVWEVAAGADEACMTRTVPFEGERLTHVGIDAMNRGAEDIDVTLRVGADADVIAERRFMVNESANRRLLLPLDRAPTGSIDVSLVLHDRTQGARLVVDNLRGFVG